MRRLIVNADDLGFTAATNRGILEGHERGLVTSTSLMVDCPGVAEGAEIAWRTPSLSVGPHAVLDHHDELVTALGERWLRRGRIAAQA